MTALKESCPTKMLLLCTWQTAAEIYSKAVAELSRQIGVLPMDDYERLQGAAEVARQRSIEAQATLKAHVREHRCDDDGEMAA